MFYLERRPSPLLAPYVRSLWLARDPAACHDPGRQRVLPNGHMQLLINLAEGNLTDLSRSGSAACSSPSSSAPSSSASSPSAPSLMVGVHRHAQLIANRDLVHLAGVVLRPGGFRPLFGSDAGDFGNQEISLEALLGADSERLRCRLREIADPHACLSRLEAILADRLTRLGFRPRCSLTTFTLRELAAGTSLREIVCRTGRSPRSLTTIFHREVGVSPKTFDRIQRFQRALTALHHGREVRWAELALRCGFYDQAHFSHEFRAFSGISPTTYTASTRVWKNHVPLD